MWAKVGYPVLRLLRFSIEDVTLNDLEGESVVAVQREWLFPNLNLKLP
jgi:16S rRNA U516 pseudouridylate synthase RsuA-like enzyme